MSGVSKVSYDLKAVKSKERQYDHKILHMLNLYYLVSFPSKKKKKKKKKKNIF